MKNNVFKYFLVCKGLSNDDVGVGGKGHRISGDTAEELVSKPAISLKKNVGGLPQNDSKRWGERISNLRQSKLGPPIYPLLLHQPCLHGQRG